MTLTLLTLPAELRNKIFGYALPSESQEFVLVDRHRGPRKPALLQVNRQTRDEAIGLYYGTSSFDFVVRDTGAAQICGWVRCLEDQAIQHLRKNKGVNIHIFRPQSHEADAARGIGKDYMLCTKPEGWFIMTGRSTGGRKRMVCPLRDVDLALFRCREGYPRDADLVDGAPTAEEMWVALKQGGVPLSKTARAIMRGFRVPTDTPLLGAAAVEADMNDDAAFGAAMAGFGRLRLA
ncbi:hypothetical protein LTR53_006402 [Teratosphaeriaceae sp. CCFEE 6253]|nr:hypothetical protein LTR53_006402 [Teratosphaeriaceae sp. CCFEE 6253]